MNGNSHIKIPPPTELGTFFDFVAKFDDGRDQQRVENDRLPFREKVGGK